MLDPLVYRKGREITLAGDFVEVRKGKIDEMEYYTGVMFSFFSPRLTSELGRGGRYDTLLQEFGRSLPAVGFSFSLDGLVDLA